MGGQLAFDLDPAENFARDDFIRGAGNAAALDLVESWPSWPARTVAIVGPEGSGKSHLAAIWAAAAGARRLASRALDETAVPAALTTGALALECGGAQGMVAEALGAEALGAGELDERALFHLLNLVQEQRALLLLTARTTPATWPIALPDLASRLRAVPVVTLAAPDDAMLRAILVKLFADRQITVDEPLVSYLMVRIERSFAAARSIVTMLDREALRRQRPVTRALAGEMLGGG
jgi:chromosomal replication initiation ATPase DnaA